MKSKEAAKVERTAKKNGAEVKVERDAFNQPQRVVIRMGAGR